MPEIPKEVLDHMLETRAGIARIETSQSNLAGYIKGVKATAEGARAAAMDVKTSLELHEASTEAHGRKQQAANEASANAQSAAVWSNRIQMVIALATLLGLLLEWRARTNAQAQGAPISVPPVEHDAAAVSPDDISRIEPTR